MKIPDSEIKRIASATIYKRGTSYYKEGRVHIKSRDPESITALVDGEQIYNVGIKFSENKISDCFCTCPYYKTMGSVCKHIVAVLKKRQAELEIGESYKDDNDRIAQSLCSDYMINTFEKPLLKIRFILNIDIKENKKCDFSVRMECGFEELKPVEEIDRFFKCYITAEDFKISKHTAINSKKYSLNENDKKIMDILCEAYQNKTCDGLFTPRISQSYIAPETAKRIFSMIACIDNQIYLNSLPLHDVRLIEDNPDVLIDINATDSEIALNICDSGISLFDDGSWFFYENSFYHTEEEWRSWFMPVYNSLVNESRTRIDFKGPSRIDFATYVYPKLRNKQGVSTYGLDSMLINEKPSFSMYFDYNNGAVSAVIKACYGSIVMQLPDMNDNSKMIVIRDLEEEEKLLSYFKGFTCSEGNYYLYDDDDIYYFLFYTVPELSNSAKIYTTRAFEELTYQRDTSLKSNISYIDKVNLLEVGFESQLTAEEVGEILKAISLKKEYVRFHDGSFLSVDDKLKKDYRLLESLNFTQSDILKGKKKLSMYHALYLEAISREDNVETDQGFNAMIKKIRKIKADIPPYLKKILRPYQTIGINWMKQLAQLGFGGILADDMGLGKTLEVIAFVMSEKKELPALVVSPSSLTYNWYSEIKRFTPNAKALLVEGSKEERTALLEKASDFDFVITSYPLLRRDIDELLKHEFSYMFIDEAQNIKNADTMNAKSVKKIKAGRKYALSGTPIENNLSELWSMFDFVMKGYLNSRKEFSGYFEKAAGEEKIEELKKKIQPFVLRRMKKDVLTELPEKIENTIYSEFVPEQRKMYEAFLKAAKKEVGELWEDSNSSMQILTILLRLRQICCHPGLFDKNYKNDSGKLILLEETIAAATSQGHRILIFSQFTSMLDIIRDRLKQAGKECFFIDGKTPSHMRTQMADRFNAGEKEIFLISLKAGGTGLNLTGADMVIHYDPWWNPAVMEQATDRAYRIGQTKAVQVIKLAARGTIEEQILKLQESKKNLADRVITKNEKTISGLTKEEILSLFE